MTGFALDATLARDTFALGALHGCHVLLMNNAALPWFILVPETSATELCDLGSDERARLDAAIVALSRFVRAEFAIDKLNVAAIGNIVRQLHIHVVGRRADDYCWPGVVWGTTAPASYPAARVAAIAALYQAQCASAA